MSRPEPTPKDFETADQEAETSSFHSERKKRKKLHCHFCQAQFWRYGSLNNHIKSTHSEDASEQKLFECGSCGTFCKNEKKFETHAISHRKKTDIFRCPCHKGFSAELLTKELASVRSFNDSVYRCQVCDRFLESDLLQEEHKSSKGHHVNASIATGYFLHCVYRNICPVTCSIKEIIFYIERVFGKTKLNGPQKGNIFQIIILISRVHETIDGTVVCGATDLCNIITHLHSRQTFVPEFVCFACPEMFNSFEDLRLHCQSQDHLDSEKGRPKTLLYSTFSCEACEAAFFSVHNLTLHVFSKRHISLTWQLEEESASSAQKEKPENYCCLCAVKCLDTTHSKSPDHTKTVALADTYLGYCRQKRLNPLRISADADDVMDILLSVEEKAGMLKVIQRFRVT